MSRLFLLTIFIDLLYTLYQGRMVYQLTMLRQCIPSHSNHQNITYLNTPSKIPHRSIAIVSDGICHDESSSSKTCEFFYISSIHRHNYVKCHPHYHLINDTHHHIFLSQDFVRETGKLFISWAKIKILLDVMQNRKYEWILWLDTDALIMNTSVFLEYFIDDNYDLIITKDHHYLNNGVFILKNSKWSFDFLKTLWMTRSPLNDEQEAMIDYLADDKHKKHVKYLPQCSFNSYWEMNAFYRRFEYGDFIIHWPGHNWKSRSAIPSIIQLGIRNCGV